MWGRRMIAPIRRISGLVAAHTGSRVGRTSCCSVKVVALGDADTEQTVEDDGSRRLSFDQAAPGVLEDLGAFGDHGG